MNRPNFLLGATIASALVLACVRTPADLERDYARTLRPAELKAQPARAASSEAAPRAPSRVIRVRVFADADYQREAIHWQEKAKLLLRSASEVLEPQLGVTFVAVEVVRWDRPPGASELSSALDALRERDRAEDVDLVLGLVGALPGVSNAPDVLGLASLFGAHAVVRNIESPAEAEALHSAFRHLPEVEREALYRERKQHKQLSVFIHEWAHTLGAFHVQDPSWMMAAGYEPRQARFAPETTKLLELSLRHSPQFRRSREAQRAFGVELRALLDGIHGPVWDGPDRDEAVRWAEAASQGEAPMRVAATLSPADERTLKAASSAHDAGRFEVAWFQLAPLVKRYPEHETVQVLGCLLELRNRPATAEETCSAVTRRFPGQPLSALALADTELAAGRWDPGVANLALARERMVGPYAGNAPTWEHLALTARNAGQVSWAEEAAGHANASPSAAQVQSWATRTRRWLALGTNPSVPAEQEGRFGRDVHALEALLDQGAQGKVRPAMARLEKDFPGAPMHRVLTCELEFRTGRGAKAKTACASALALAPEAVHAHYLSALLALDSGDRAAAKTHLRRVIDLDPSHRDAWTTLAGLLRATGPKAELDTLRSGYRDQFSANLP